MRKLMLSLHDELVALIKVAVLMMAALIGGVIAWSLSHRISHLTHATVALAEGNLATRVVDRGHDEITKLAKHFNLMGELLDSLSQNWLPRETKPGKPIQLKVPF